MARINKTRPDRELFTQCLIRYQQRRTFWTELRIFGTHSCWCDMYSMHSACCISARIRIAIRDGLRKIVEESHALRDSNVRPSFTSHARSSTAPTSSAHTTEAEDTRALPRQNRRNCPSVRGVSIYVKVRGELNSHQHQNPQL